jgi:E3 ubiquitin-protein ligase UHRF1
LALILIYFVLKLVDGHTLFDYSVGLNDLIQLMIKAPPPAQDTKETEKDGDTRENGSDKENEASSS